MDAWAFQGIELQPDEEPTKLVSRISGLEEALGLSVLFQAVGTFRAPLSKTYPPRYNPKGQLRRFLHVLWQGDSAQAWALLLHVAHRDHRALLSSFTGVGFLSKDIDFRDGHPRESVLLTAFNSNAEDFHEPLAFPSQNDPEELAVAWRSRIDEEAARLRDEGSDPMHTATAVELAREHRVRFEYGWYLNSGEWRSRYLVQPESGPPAIAAAQDSLCTCASRRPETLQLMMPSEECVHHLVAKLVDRVAESALSSSGSA